MRSRQLTLFRNNDAVRREKTLEELWAIMYLNAYCRVTQPMLRRGGPILSGRRPHKNFKKLFQQMSQIDPASDASNPGAFSGPVQILADGNERRCLADMESLCLPENPRIMAVAGGGDPDKEREAYFAYHNAKYEFVKWNREQLKMPLEMTDCSTCGHPTPVVVLYESKGRQQCLHCKTYWHEAQRYGV